MKVERSVTRIEVNAPPAEIAKAFPCELSRTVTKIRHKRTGEVIYEQAFMRSSAINVARAILKHTQSFEIVQERTRETSEHTAEIEGKFLLLSRGKEGTCMVEVDTYTDDLDHHYEEVDGIVAVLKAAGFEVEDSECQVTITRKC